MNQLHKAIYSRYNSSTGAALRSISSSMYMGTAPEGTTGEPIIVKSLPGETTRTMEPLTNGATYDTIPVDFHVWSDKATSSNAWAVVDALKTLYDDIKLSVSGYSTLEASRLNHGAELQDDDDNGWEVTVSYEYTIGK